MASRKKYDPIASFGVILYSKNEQGEIVFLLYQRRDTYEYMEFMRGIWAEYNLPKIFSNMTLDERDRIRNYTFKELWDDLFVVKTYKIYEDCYEKAERKYNSVRPSIPTYLERIQSAVQNAPWGFPKGKKNGHLEDPLACAKREFEEETKFTTNGIIFHEGLVYQENFIGSNNRAYSSTYFVGRCETPITPVYIDTHNHIRQKTISEEAADLGWFTLEEAKTLLDSRKVDILVRILCEPSVVGDFQGMDFGSQRVSEIPETDS